MTSPDERDIVERLTEEVRSYRFRLEAVSQLNRRHEATIEKHRAAVEELRGTLTGWHENQAGITEDEAIEKLVAVAEAARSLIAIGEAVKG